MDVFAVTNEDEIKLKKYLRSGAAGHEVVRAMTLLLKQKGQTRAEIADTLDITPRTVTNTCNNYLEYGFDRAIKDDPRPGQPVIVDDRIKSKIVAMVCSNPPEGFDRWTLELLQSEAQERGVISSISKEKIRVILKEHDLKPWQQKMWCIPKLDQEYIDRMEKILDLYGTPDTPLNPLICLDEKPVILFSDKREPILMERGSPKKVDYEYKRNGSNNVFMAVEPYTGKYYAKVTKQRTGSEFANFLAEIADKYKNAKKINLVMDNLNIHKISSLIKEFGEKRAEKIWDRFNIYYTPVHGSWLNQAEIAIGMYSRQCLGKTRIGTTENLIRKTKAWMNYINDKRPTINWTFSKHEAREKMGYR